MNSGTIIHTPSNKIEGASMSVKAGVERLWRKVSFIGFNNSADYKGYGKPESMPNETPRIILRHALRRLVEVQ
jgi:hypothetical protein